MDSKKIKVLTLNEKAEILERFKKGESVTNLSKKYGVAKSTICSIKKKKDLILKCVNNTYSGPGKRKTLRSSKLPKMEKFLYRWFIGMREKNLPVSGLMLKEKAKKLHSKLKENSVGGFLASDGWLRGFKKRYGIRLLKITGEKLSSQPHLVLNGSFKLKLKETIEKMGLCKDQLYNADESGLLWKLLPDKTYFSTVEKSASGAKSEKQQLTFLCCANASGTHRLKFLVIGKAKNSRSFKNFTWPTDYKSSKSSWMTTTIFMEWFHKSFVPQVKAFLSQKNLPLKALLLLDNNAASHPNASELKSEDGNIIAMFMPPNITPLIQPMDQNAIKITKLYYRSSLLASIAAKDSNLIECMKCVTLKEAVILLEDSWNRVSAETLAKCWANILSFLKKNEDNIPLSVLKEEWDSELKPLITSTVLLLQSLNPELDFPLSIVEEWNEDDMLFNPSQNNENDQKENDDAYVEEENLQRVSATEAVESFNKALEWCANEGVDQSDINVLKRLRENAVIQMLGKIQQKKITDFFVR